MLSSLALRITNYSFYKFLFSFSKVSSAHRKGPWGPQLRVGDGGKSHPFPG